MPEVHIRPAMSSDINEIIQFDHAGETNYVWQMDRSKEDEDFRISFRQMRLPRSVQIRYPRSPELLKNDWQKKAVILVASLKSQLVGYAAIDFTGSNTVAWITDLVVNYPFRRKGIGSALMIAAQDWALRHRVQKMIIEVQPKNHPGISLAKKAGLEFCGYNDYYFASQDLALFFGCLLRK
jgi:GNAT superfamily N-acetyltransferase